LPPAMLALIVGRRLLTNVPANTLLSEAMLDGGPLPARGTEDGGNRSKGREPTA
jgi:hypothetical protein